MAQLQHRFFRASRMTAALALGLLISGNASAMGLLDAYQAALKADPTYQSAIHEHQAGQEAIAIGRSGLLPNLSLNYSSGNNLANTVTQTIEGPYIDNPHYASRTGSLVLRQPLINLEGVAHYQQGIAQAKASDAQFVEHQRELMLRVVGAYMDVLAANDQLLLATAHRDALAEQKQANLHMLDKGEGTRTDVLETKSKADLAEAQVLEARDNLEAARRTLAGIVGQNVAQMDAMSGNFPILTPPPFDVLSKAALANNATLTALRYNVQASRDEVRRDQAGHIPRVDFVASLNKQDSSSIQTYNQDAKVRTFGFEVNAPIYGGGYVSALTRQAQANLERAQTDLAAQTNTVLVDLRKQYDLVLSSAARINALIEATNSAKLLITATHKSIQGGVRVNLDLLNAEEQLYTAQRDLAQARYNYLIAYMKMRSDAGLLSAQDLSQLAAYFPVAGTKISLLQ